MEDELQNLMSQVESNIRQAEDSIEELKWRARELEMWAIDESNRTSKENEQHKRF